MYQDQMKWFSRPQRTIVNNHKEVQIQQEEEFAEKLDLIYADRLDRKEKEILERLGHVDKELAKTLGFVETEYLRLRKFQDKLNTYMESHKELQSDNAVLRATINDLQSKEKKQEEEFAEKLDLIEKKYADRLDHREREILERLDHVDNELAKRLGFVETESAVRLGKFQAKLNACNTRLSNAESCISLLPN